jgi:hypothetical protein
MRLLTPLLFVLFANSAYAADNGLITKPSKYSCRKPSRSFRLQ